jgi:hypothetical protein
LILCWAAVACTESDTVFRDIGTTRVFFVDPALRPQGFTDPESRIQAADWEILTADFLYEGVIYDLRFGENCFYSDSAFILPVADGKCGPGIVIESNEEPILVTLSVEFTMKVRRAKPLILPDMGDFDGDGRLNAVDNCVLQDNPDQQDLDGNLIGDTCSLIDPISGGVSRDSDVDGVPDSIDNCLWVPNPLQLDEDGGDAIGDACAEQEADVRAGGSPMIRAESGPIGTRPLAISTSPYSTIASRTASSRPASAASETHPPTGDLQLIAQIHGGGEVRLSS